MGQITTICSDKTGTLTQNQMSLSELFLGGIMYNVQEKNKINPQLLQTLCEGICINSTAYPRKIQGKYEHNGNETECSLLHFAYQCGYKYESYRPSANIINVLQFSSQTKRMTTLYQTSLTNFKVFCKGAPAYLLNICTKYLDIKGKSQKINENFLSLYHAKLKLLQSYKMRLIILAYKEIDSQNENILNLSLESNLIFICLAAIKDSIRPEAKDVVRQLKEAGIDFLMITGDNEQTAIAIADDIGILNRNESNVYEQVIQGQKLVEVKLLRFQFRSNVGVDLIAHKAGQDELTVRNMRVFAHIAQSLKILARATAEDKLILVGGLTQLKNVVAVSGNGINDVNALQKAAVGFAMGSGSQIAKKAADVVFLDDNLKKFKNNIKFMSFQFSQMHSNGQKYFSKYQKIFILSTDRNLCYLLLDNYKRLLLWDFLFGFLQNSLNQYNFKFIWIINFRKRITK